MVRNAGFGRVTTAALRGAVRDPDQRRRRAQLRHALRRRRPPRRIGSGSALTSPKRSGSCSSAGTARERRRSSAAISSRRRSACCTSPTSSRSTSGSRDTSGVGCRHPAGGRSVDSDLVDCVVTNHAEVLAGLNGGLLGRGHRRRPGHGRCDGGRRARSRPWRRWVITRTSSHRGGRAIPAAWASWLVRRRLRWACPTASCTTPVGLALCTTSGSSVWPTRCCNLHPPAQRRRARTGADASVPRRTKPGPCPHVGRLVWAIWPPPAP